MTESSSRAAFDRHKDPSITLLKDQVSVVTERISVSSSTTIDPILIVGGGPTGLIMASELARRNVPFRLIDISRSATDKSKAIGIQARTLELFDNAGIAGAFTSLGKRADSVNVYHDDKKLLRLTFSELDSPYPYILMLPQSETEHILVDHLEKLGGSVEREVRLTTFSQDRDGVTASLQHSDGSMETVRTPWLVGCDGAGSTVRHILNQPFLGEEYQEGFQLADVKILWLLKDDEIYVFVHDGWLVAAFPLPGGHHRLIADVPPDRAPQDKSPTLEEWQKLVDERLPVKATLSEPRWTANYRIHRRLAANLKVGRAFLVGDAAHIHSPAGAQGMNTGIQDAVNLAWKMAMVAQNHGGQALLDSYHAERYPVEKAVLSATDFPLQVMGLTNPVAQAARDSIMPLLAGMGMVQERVRRLISELSVHYLGSPIVNEYSLGSGPKAGERAPNGVAHDAIGTEFQLFNIINGPMHKLLVFDPAKTAGDESDVYGAVAHLVRTKLNNAVKICRFTSGSGPISANIDCIFTDASGALHDRYGARRGAVYLIRPDGYIGFRCPLDGALDRLREHLDRVYTS